MKKTLIFSKKYPCTKKTYFVGAIIINSKNNIRTSSTIRSIISSKVKTCMQKP